MGLGLVRVNERRGKKNNHINIHKAKGRKKIYINKRKLIKYLSYALQVPDLLKSKWKGEEEMRLVCFKILYKLNVA